MRSKKVTPTKNTSKNAGDRAGTFTVKPRKQIPLTARKNKAKNKSKQADFDAGKGQPQVRNFPKGSQPMGAGSSAPSKRVTNGG
jgi:hypothetical protein